jgi:arsenate reductase (thioredoxin)
MSNDAVHPDPSTGPASPVVPLRRDLEALSLLSTDHHLARTAEALSERFAGVFSPETVAACVVESHQLLTATAKLHTHLSVLAERFARERLAAAAQAQGALVSDVPEVLFVCVHNAGRSQMAAALLDHHAQGAVHVRSAGSTPAHEINPAVREVMAELGLDLSREFPKPLTTDVVEAADVVITMGCGDACPVFPGKRYLDWELTDPAGKGVDDVRPIRDDIDRRVRELLAELVPARTVGPVAERSR